MDSQQDNNNWFKEFLNSMTRESKQNEAITITKEV